MLVDNQFLEAGNPCWKRKCLTTPQPFVSFVSFTVQYLKVLGNVSLSICLILLRCADNRELQPGVMISVFLCMLSGICNSLRTCPPEDWVCGGGLLYERCGAGGLGDICFCDVTLSGSKFCASNVRCADVDKCNDDAECPGNAKCLSTCCDGGNVCVPECPFVGISREDTTPEKTEPGLCSTLSTC